MRLTQRLFAHLLLVAALLKTGSAFAVDFTFLDYPDTKKLTKELIKGLGSALESNKANKAYKTCSKFKTKVSLLKNRPRMKVFGQPINVELYSSVNPQLDDKLSLGRSGTLVFTGNPMPDRLPGAFAVSAEYESGESSVVMLKYTLKGF